MEIRRMQVPDSMPRLADASPKVMDLRSRQHPACFVCSPGRSHGLGLQFRLQPDGSVADNYTFGPDLEGYPGVVHGGIVAATLDGAMTNWLFLHNHSAVTAELKVRYLLPVASGVPALIQARWTEGSGVLFVMTAELLQGGRKMAAATAKFIANTSSSKITRGHT